MADYTKSIKKIKAEMPDQADTSVEPSGFLGKFLGRGSIASTNPFTGSVNYNPDEMSKLSPDEVDNTFAHELTHSRQVQAKPYLNRFLDVGRSMLPGFLGGSEESDPYQRPREMEAYQTEMDRSSRLGLNTPNPMTGARDIELPNPMAISKRKAMFDRLRGVR